MCLAARYSRLRECSLSAKVWKLIDIKNRNSKEFELPSKRSVSMNVYLDATRVKVLLFLSESTTHSVLITPFVFHFSALDKIIVQGYKALQLEYFFTAGPDEVKAWTIQVSFCSIVFDAVNIRLLTHQTSDLFLSIYCCFSLQKNTKAPQAPGRIHTDFEKGFIMAEVMKFEDFKEEGSEAACKVRKIISFSRDA